MERGELYTRGNGVPKEDLITDNLLKDEDSRALNDDDSPRILEVSSCCLRPALPCECVPPNPTAIVPVRSLRERVMSRK